MHRIAVRADFFDASALVKIYSDEPSSDVVRQYFNARATKYTTPFCFYEAMNVLKGKWKHKNQLSLDQYIDAAFRLTVWYGASSSWIDDLDFADPLTFSSARTLAKRSELDQRSVLTGLPRSHRALSRRSKTGPEGPCRVSQRPKRRRCVSLSAPPSLCSVACRPTRPLMSNAGRRRRCIEVRGFVEGSI